MKSKIMLVDDIDISNIIMQKIIKLSTSNVEIFDYTDPVFAYSSLSEINPDLIFLDLNMPQMDGWQFLEKMKSDNYTNKVVVLTSSISILDKQTAFAFFNVIDFCEKPVNKNQISSYLEKSIAKSN